jgi:hypothetical protein
MEPAETTAIRPRHLTLRIFFLLFSLSELVAALFDLPSLQIAHLTSTADGRIAGFLSDASTALAPLVAGAAFVFAIVGQLPRAVAAMAALLLVRAIAALGWAVAFRDAWAPADSSACRSSRPVMPIRHLRLRRWCRCGVAAGSGLPAHWSRSRPAWSGSITSSFLFVLIATDPD